VTLCGALNRQTGFCIAAGSVRYNPHGLNFGARLALGITCEVLTVVATPSDADPKKSGLTDRGQGSAKA
jgi:hypothetical protein